MSAPRPLSGKAAAHGPEAHGPEAHGPEAHGPEAHGAATTASAADLADVSEDDLVRIATELGQEMKRVGVLIATAESCTGGLLARVLTETAGSSDWFERGFVTYSNEAKIDLLGVRLATLQAHGAVSQAVAREMAAGALEHSPAGVSLAVTGIAGPGGAVDGKPVGTVCFGWGLAWSDGDREPLVVSGQRHFPGDRAAVRRQSAAHALIQATLLLRRRLQDQPPVG